MSVELLDDVLENSMIDESIGLLLNNPLNGTDARRRLEDKLEERRLLKELKEFDFELN